MLYKVNKNTFCVNDNVMTVLEKDETVQIEKRTDKEGNVVIKIYRDIFLGILDDNDAIRLDL